MSRIVPITRLHRYYKSLEVMNTDEQTQECRSFNRDPRLLLDLFLNSVSEFEVYRNLEGFGSSPRVPVNAGNSRHRVVARLKSSPKIRVPDGDGAYVFRYVGREINPWRTTRSTFSDGTPASSTGAGGIDYLARTVGDRERPVLGEIKVGSDKTAFYAFVQLLNYLSKFATRNQIDRCNRFLTFGGSVEDPPAFHLHILLADFNDRGTKGQTILLTSELAMAFNAGLIAAGRGGLVGRILCLEMRVEHYADSLSRVWDVQNRNAESGIYPGEVLVR
jgi:hypothetical protein